MHLMTFPDKHLHAKMMLSKNLHRLASHNLIQVACNPKIYTHVITKILLTNSPLIITEKLKIEQLFINYHNKYNFLTEILENQ